MQFHSTIMSIFLLLWLSVFSPFEAVQVTEKNTAWKVIFGHDDVFLHIGEIVEVNFTIPDLTKNEIERGIVTIISDNGGHIARANPLDKKFILKDEALDAFSEWSSSFNISGNFLGYAHVRLRYDSDDGKVTKESLPLTVKVIRQERLVDTLFTYSVAIFASVIYVNFGCAIDWSAFKSTVKKPIAPVIGFISQFLFMPVISYVVGKLLFSDSVAMQLGMFFTGVSPAGGASNIWTLALDGNIALSITMTTISTFAAFAMMPLWIFTLGRLIFEEGELGVPYSRIGSFAIALVVPLLIGFLIQRFLPRVAKIMSRILKPFAAVLIVFIVIFAIITNMYLFELFTWRIIIAGLGLPWLGFLFGALFAWLLRQSAKDILTISIETGIQNTGISIFLLRFSLGQPEADLTTVVPVSVAILTPVPLIVLFIMKYCHKRFIHKHMIDYDPEDVEKINSYSVSNCDPETLAIKNGKNGCDLK